MNFSSEHVCRTIESLLAIRFTFIDTLSQILEETNAISQWFDSIDVLFQNKFASVQSICRMKKNNSPLALQHYLWCVMNIGVMDD